MHAAVQESPEVSVNSSTSALPNATWWAEVQANNPFSSTWTTMSRWTSTPPSNHHRSDVVLSSSYADADMSISNVASCSRSALSMDSSSADLSGEPVEDNHLWNQVLLNVENGGDQIQRNSQVVDDADNFLEVLSSKRKMDCNWPELLHPSSSLKYFLEKQLGSYTNYESNWSLAPHPSSHLDHPRLLAPSSCNDAYIKPGAVALYPSNAIERDTTCASFLPSYDHQSMKRDHSQFAWLNNQRNLQDQVPFGGCLNKAAAVELQASKPYVKNSDPFFDGNKQGYESSSLQMRDNGRSSRTIEGKKRRPSEDSSEMQLKKAKSDSSVVSSNKQQVPKVKIAEKISALQQLVSPFGKTDQASVLMETINCIKVLQEQVQLLSDPYLKSGGCKKHNSWGEMERKENTELKYDLRSRGLCLVPVSSIPQVHRESCRPDYWMPTYRNCFYR
ncbi:hypothetical protein Cni_G18531 [Canna indica]|uniref:BHLH domain-containing protein n=1 Tax=Canna indica TaxID=4628 RepID=A0AAQ3QHS0_9LILI|nr:hypothetical protein Cni_G18531 [Canna indica]